MAYYTTNERSVPGTARSDQRGSYFGMYKTPKFAPPNQTSYMEQTMSVIVEDEPEAINARLFSSTTRETPKPASTRRRKASLLPSKEGRVKVDELRWPLAYDIDFRVVRKAVPVLSKKVSGSGKLLYTIQLSDDDEINSFLFCLFYFIMS